MLYHDAQNLSLSSLLDDQVSDPSVLNSTLVDALDVQPGQPVTATVCSPLPLSFLFPVDTAATVTPA